MDYVWVTCNINDKEYKFTYEYDLIMEDMIDELLEQEIEKRYKDDIINNDGKYNYHIVEY